MTLKQNFRPSYQRCPQYSVDHLSESPSVPLFWCLGCPLISMFSKQNAKLDNITVKAEYKHEGKKLPRTGNVFSMGTYPKLKVEQVG